MSYRLKSIRYKDKDRKILLQNENGPCPLIATANALLLRGALQLPAECVSRNMIQLEELVNILAEVALSKQQQQQQQQNEKGVPASASASSSNFYLNELLTLFPKMQYGLDVNPKFTSGPTGVEYTSNLTAFEVLGVDLVHGWLLDPQDVETYRPIQNKTYNELVEMVIQGSETKEKVQKLEKEISACEEQLQALPSDETIELEMRLDSSSSPATPDLTPDSSSNTNGTSTPLSGSLRSSLYPTAPAIETSETRSQLERVLSEKRQEWAVQSRTATEASLIQNFLDDTGHQLTHFGLIELYNHLENDQLCVFFRNNHYSTLTKQNGVLYMLVTDLGYATVPEIVWEKLDAIDGDTEYMNARFEKPAPQTELLPPPPHAAVLDGANLTGSQRDLQLALQLSQCDMAPAGAPPNGGVTETATNPTAPTGHLSLAEEEGKMMAAVMESSLREYNNRNAGMVSIPDGAKPSDVAIGTLIDIPPAEIAPGVGIGTLIDIPTEPSSQPPAAAAVPAASSPQPASPAAVSPQEQYPATPSVSMQEEMDHVVAMNLQREDHYDFSNTQASETLARQLQAEEHFRSQRNANNNNRNNNNRRRGNQAEKKSGGCVIS